MEDDKILLLKLGGIKIRVPREKMSLQDLAYVEDILETEFGSEDNTTSDIMQAEESRPDADTPLRTALSARMIFYDPNTEGEGWFIVQALLEDGQTWELTRPCGEFYKLNMEVLDEFPSEALHNLHGRFTRRNLNQLHGLNDYLGSLLGRKPIRECMAVKRFFAPRDGDDEIDPVNWTEPSTDALYYPQPPIGSD